METPEEAHDRRVLRWDGTVTAGNVLTAAALVIALLGWGFRLEAQVDRSNYRIQQLEASQRLDEQERGASREATGRITERLDAIQRALTRTEVLLDRVVTVRTAPPASGER